MSRVLREIIGNIVRDHAPERIAPGEGNLFERYLFRDHLARYKFAEKIVADKSVLDIACGPGYGSDLLAHSARSVTGVDISGDVIREAEKKYRQNNLQFVCSDALKFLEKYPGVYDVICSFETIEHLDEPERFIDLIFTRLGENGTLVISSPNREFGDLLLGGVTSPYHTREFHTEELRRMLMERFGTEPQVYRERPFNQKRMTISALLSLADPNPKIIKNEVGISSVTDIFVVRKD